MVRLTDIGFKKVGNWILDNDKFNHSIVDSLTERNLLYSFICDSTVFYIGKTTSSLANRMNGYKNADKSQRTNIRIKTKIIELLMSGKCLDIYILTDNSNLKYENYAISLASGLEDSLISQIKPEWNKRGNIRVKEQVTPTADKSTIVEDVSISSDETITFHIVLGKTYLNKGFFNFPQKASPQLPSKASDVNLLLGEKNKISGRFLFANENKQPRVYGYDSLKEWFQKNYKQGDEVRIDILEPDLYRIN